MYLLLNELALELSAAIMFASCQKAPMFVLSQLRFWVNTGPNLKLSNSRANNPFSLCIREQMTGN